MKRFLTILVVLLSVTQAQAQQSGGIYISGGGGSSFGGSAADLTGTTSVCYAGDGLANAICLVAAGIVVEGATANDFETLLTVTDPTADRTITFPNATGTVPLLESAQTWTASNTFTAASGVDVRGSMRIGTSDVGRIREETALTPDALSIALSASPGHSLHIMSTSTTGDLQNGPCGTGNCADPHVIVHPNVNSNTTDYSGLSYYGTAGKFVVALTESSATNVVTIPVADNTSIAGTLKAKVFASDGTDHQARYASLSYVAVNEGDTETCTLSGADQTDDGNIAAITTGTLTYTWACAGATDAVTITLNAVSSLTQTTLSLEGHLTHVGAGEPLPQ